MYPFSNGQRLRGFLPGSEDHMYMPYMYRPGSPTSEHLQYGYEWTGRPYYDLPGMEDRGLGLQNQLWQQQAEQGQDWLIGQGNRFAWDMLGSNLGWWS